MRILQTVTAMIFSLAQANALVGTILNGPATPVQTVTPHSTDETHLGVKHRCLDRVSIPDSKA
jgi:hypothetical protein